MNILSLIKAEQWPCSQFHPLKQMKSQKRNEYLKLNPLNRRNKFEAFDHEASKPDISCSVLHCLHTSRDIMRFSSTERDILFIIILFLHLSGVIKIDSFTISSICNIPPSEIDLGFYFTSLAMQALLTHPNYNLTSPNLHKACEMYYL